MGDLCSRLVDMVVDGMGVASAALEASFDWVAVEFDAGSEDGVSGAGLGGVPPNSPAPLKLPLPSPPGGRAGRPHEIARGEKETYGGCVTFGVAWARDGESEALEGEGCGMDFGWAAAFGGGVRFGAGSGWEAALGCDVGGGEGERT